MLHCDKLHFCYFSSCRWDFLVASVQVLTFLEQVSKNVFMRTVQHYQIVFHLGLVVRARPPTNRGHWPFMCGTEPKKCSAVFYHVDTSVVLQVFVWHRCSVFLTHASQTTCTTMSKQLQTMGMWVLLWVPAFTFTSFYPIKQELLIGSGIDKAITGKLTTAINIVNKGLMLGRNEMFEICMCID